ncbi:hypothetical protein M8J77_025339 [Diaphorina citri]|nr:hypothetical protein M8J77_025339 [Diaphorina citri]
MFQLNDILPEHSPPLQRKPNNLSTKRSSVERKTSGASLGAIEAVVTGTPSVKDVIEEPAKTSRDKINDDISYTLRSNCRLKPNRVFTITPVKTDDNNGNGNVNEIESKSNGVSNKPNKQLVRAAVRRTTSGLPIVGNSTLHSDSKYNSQQYNNELKTNKLFLRNDTSPVIFTSKNNNASKTNVHDHTSEHAIKNHEPLIKSLSGGSASSRLPNSNLTISTGSGGGNTKLTSVFGRSNTEAKLPKQLQPQTQTSSIVFQQPAMARSMTQDSFNELIKNNFNTMPAGSTQFFIRQPGSDSAGPAATALVRSNTETSLVDDQLDDLGSNSNSLNRNSGMRVLGYIWTFWNKGQSPSSNSTSSSSSNGIIRIPPAAVVAGSSPIMPGGGGGPGVGGPATPASKVKPDQMIRPKVVVALYPFKAIEGGDLSLEKGAEYEVMDDTQEHWWKVKDKNGSVGYIPSNYVKEKELLGLQKYEWYVGDMSRQRAESILKQEDKEGCFVVRNSSTKGLYTLSLYTKVPHPHVKHYHIKQNSRGEFFLSEKHCCHSIPEVVNYHRHNSGGLASRLKTSPCDRPVPATAGLSHDKWEIDPAELMLLEELGSGQFGVVRRGKWRGSIDVAVKMMKEGTMSEDDFIEEAKVMTRLQHQNLVQLYGVCSKHRPIYIVTEYMRHGSLLNYLRRHENTLGGNVGLLLDMCIQVCKGMAYLERHNYIHRDLAARNCLVGSENVVKVADFGLARYVLDDQYTSSGGTKFPIKWAPPEVLNYTRFSSKSDVWAYGVLMWEVFTCGKMPYGRLKNTEVVDRVQRGIILEKPKACFKEVYDVMRQCWSHNPEERPSFRVLKDALSTVSQGLLAD